MDLKVVLKVFVDGAHVGRDMTFKTQAEVSTVVEEIKAAHPDQIEAGADYCLHIPDPKLHPDQQWLEGAMPLGSATVTNGDRVELRRVPLKLTVFFAVENKNLVRALRRSKTRVHLEPNMEIVLAIGRLKRALGDTLPPDEYCLALVNRDQGTEGAEQRFSANWINGNSTPEFYGMGPDAELLLWPLRLFMRKTAEDLKNPTCAGPLKITKKENPSKAERRFCVIKFNLFFSYTQPRNKTPEILANLEHYFVTSVEKEGKKKWKFRLEKVMESFTPTAKLYWLVFDDENTAKTWNAALSTECANRQGGTKLPPPRITIPDKVPKNLFPKDPVALPQPPHDPPRLDLAEVVGPDTSAQFVANRILAGQPSGGGGGKGDAAARASSPPNVLSPMRDSGLFAKDTESPSGSADPIPLASAMGAPPPPGGAGAAPLPLASEVGAPPPPGPGPGPAVGALPLASAVGAPPPPSSSVPLASEMGAPPPPSSSAAVPLAAAVGAPPPPGVAALPPPPSSAGGAALPPPGSLPPPPLASQVGAPPPPGGAPAGGGPPVIDRCVARYSYEATDAENEQGERAISFSKGVTLDVYEKREDGWCKAHNPQTGATGLVPFNFLREN